MVFSISAVAALYNPPLQKALRLQKYLMAIGEDEKFSSIFEATVYAEDYDEFYAAVEKIVSSQNAQPAL